MKISSLQNKMPAVVVVAYNRSHSLDRILGALARAEYPDADIPLIISIDRSDNPDVRSIAEAFDWQFGSKKIIAHEYSLGLKDHVLFCGDLSATYGSVILFEDDLYPSRHFYAYCLAACNTFADDERIAGISLYAHRTNETAFMRFTPLQDNSDVFFMRLPSSWGQMWTKSQWEGFRNWLEEQGDFPVSSVPPNVRLWPESSWKRWAIAYVVAMNKFYVYPHQSLSTNFSDIGANHHTTSTRFQVPLQLFRKEYNFLSLDRSFSVYDEYCELLPDRLQRLVPELKDIDFAVDLYGQRDLTCCSSTSIITPRSVSNPSISWGRKLKPHEMNLIENVPGNHLYLGSVIDCDQTQQSTNVERVCYYYNVARRVLTWCKDEI